MTWTGSFVAVLVPRSTTNFIDMVSLAFNFDVCQAVMSWELDLGLSNVTRTLFKLRPPHFFSVNNIDGDLLTFELHSKISVLGWILMPICLNCEKTMLVAIYVTIVTITSLVKLLSSNVFLIEAYLFDSLK